MIDVKGELLTSLEEIFPTKVTLGSGRPGVIEFIYPKVTAAKLEIFANEHPPPHFRVTYDHRNANYSLRDGKRLSGNAPIGLKDRQVLKWWKQHRIELVNLWNQTRPYDCPVGVMVIPSDWKEGA